MNSPLFRKALPHLIAIVVFLLVAVVYCKPALDGKVLNQSDVIGWKGMAQQSFEYKEKYGHYLEEDVEDFVRGDDFREFCLVLCESAR